MNAHVALTIGEVFGNLASKTSKDFEVLGRKSWHPSGAILFGAGEPCSGIFWASSGQVRVSVSDDFGRCVMSHMARPAELLGLKAALCNEAYGATARTESPSNVSFVSRDDFSTFLFRHPDAAFRIVEQLSHRLGLALDEVRAASTVNLRKPSN